jgi:hypothetical protein
VTAHAAADGVHGVARITLLGTLGDLSYDRHIANRKALADVGEFSDRLPAELADALTRNWPRLSSLILAPAS